MHEKPTKSQKIANDEAQKFPKRLEQQEKHQKWLRARPADKRKKGLLVPKTGVRQPELVRFGPYFINIYSLFFCGFSALCQTSMERQGAKN